MEARIRVKGLNDAARKALQRHVNRAARKVSAVLLAQTARRFRQGGDEEIRWAELWVNSAGPSRTPEARSEGARGARRKALDSARKSADRLRSKIQSGERDDARAQRQLRAKIAQYRRARDSFYSGRPLSYRHGGTPLSDTGALRQSVRSLIIEEPAALRATARIGSSLPYARLMQSGDRLREGPWFVPLTRRARVAGEPGGRLIAGYDYVYLQRRRIPPRPFVRMTVQNIEEVRSIIGGGR